MVVSEIWEVPLEVGSLYIPLCISERFLRNIRPFSLAECLKPPIDGVPVTFGSDGVFDVLLDRFANWETLETKLQHGYMQHTLPFFVYVFFVYALPLLIDFVPLCSLILHNEHTWNPHFQFVFPRKPWRFGTCLLVATKFRGFGDDDLGKGRVANLWVFQPKRPFKITRGKRSSLYLWFSWY